MTEPRTLDPAHHARLLRRFHRGDEPAARLLWDHHAPRLRAIARARLASAPLDAHAAADDIVQRVFLALLRLPARDLRAIRDPDAYLARAARAASIDLARAEARAERRDRLHAPNPNHIEPRDTDPVARALSTLHPDDRELLTLRSVLRLSFDQIAAVLACPRSTAHDRHAAALERLRRALPTDETQPSATPSTAPAQATP